MKQQSSLARHLAPRDISLISTMGQEHPAGEYCYHPEWTTYRQDKVWGWRHICRYESFTLVAGEECASSPRSTAYTRWEDYVKVSFWLGGKHTTVLDGFGHYEHGCPEVFIVCGPPGMLKVDVPSAGTPTAGIALCLRRDFFLSQLDVVPEELPPPLRSIVRPENPSYGFHRFRLTPDLLAATRSVLAVPAALRRAPVYGQAKAVELMSLLIERMASDARGHGERQCTPRETRLREARALLARRYAEALTLEQVAREVGLNRMALTSGFRQLYRMSVYECLQKERMERAYELLQDEVHTVAQVAEAVGYTHSCTFSTAFRAHFGHPPRKARPKN